MARDTEQLTRRALFAAACLAVLMMSFYGVGCSRRNAARPGTLAMWERQLGLKPRALETETLAEPKRRLADNSAPRCWKDRMTAAMIRADIARVEGERGGTRVTGTWRGVDLGALTAPQAQYLKIRDGDWLHADGVDLSGCADVPCILDRLYGRDSGDAGLKTYWWWLRMGYVLVMDDKIVGVGREEGADFRKYLFENAELNAFWKLSWALPESFRYMGALQTFNRIPRGQRLTSWGECNPLGGCTCGDAGGNRTRGFIRLSDSCLDMPDDERAFQGFLYLGVTHEMSHRLDDWLGDDRKGISDMDEWQTFSGWNCGTTVNPGTGDAASSCVREDFVRAYAGTSAAEDWADTTAYFRFEPARAREKSPRKSEYVSRHVYGGRSYEPAGLLKAYEEMSERALAPQLLELVEACAGGNAPAPAPSSAPAGVATGPQLTLDMPLPESVVGCLERGLRERLSAAFDRIRLDEPEACDTLTSASEGDIASRLFNKFTPDIKALVQRQQALREMLRVSREIRNTLGEEVDPREAFLHCHRLPNAEACFTQAISDGFDRATQTFVVSQAEVVQRERASFIAENTFERARAKTIELYRFIFAGVDSLVATSARNRWDACWNGGNPSATPSASPAASAADSGGVVLTQPFTGGSHFVSAQILNCINGDVNNDLAQARTRYAGRLSISVTDPDAIALVNGFTLPVYVDVLRQKVDDAAKSEDEALATRKPGVIDVLVNELVGDTGWIGGSADRAGALTRCQPAAEGRFDAYFARVEAGNALAPRFSAVEDLRRDWARGACMRAVDSPAAQRSLAAAAEQARAAQAREFTASLTELESFVAARAHDPGLECKRRNPGSQYFTRRRRAECLKGRWTAIETAALGDWDGSVRGQQFQSRRSEARQHLTRRKAALQEAAVSAMESGR